MDLLEANRPNPVKSILSGTMALEAERQSVEVAGLGADPVRPDVRRLDAVF